MSLTDGIKSVVISGVVVPPFFYGTAWKENETERCVADALTAGFRGIDTANQRKHYFEAGVGIAIKKHLSLGQVRREDLFLQTKFTSVSGQDDRLPYDPKTSLKMQVSQSFSSSLKHLHTDFIDSYVLHGPSRSRGLEPEDWEIWNAMEALVQEKKVRFLGISNVNLEQLRLLVEGSKIKPTFVQNRCYAMKGWDLEIRRFCRDNEIHYQGFSLLTANSAIFHDPRFIKIVGRLGCTQAQAVFGFSLRVGMIPLTGTSDPLHMAEDLKSLTFELSDQEIEIIEHLLT